MTKAKAKGGTGRGTGRKAGLAGKRASRKRQPLKCLAERSLLKAQKLIRTAVKVRTKGHLVLKQVLEDQVPLEVEVKLAELKAKARSKVDIGILMCR